MIQANPPDEGSRVQVTFCFVDVAGYTALTETHGDEAAAALVEHFHDLITEAVGERGTLVDAVGDAALIVFSDTPSAVLTLQNLFARAAAEPNFPALRAGLHRGPALYRKGRYFGSTLNTAARIAGQAGSNRVLASTGVAEAAQRMGYTVQSCGTYRLRNLTAPLLLHEIQLTLDSDDQVIDPVCRMQLQRAQAAESVQAGGEQYWFCSSRCAALFAGEPALYINEAS